MTFALDLLLSGIAVLVLVDLTVGLARGRLWLLDGDRKANSAKFWFYAFAEAVLVAFVASIWL